MYLFSVNYFPLSKNINSFFIIFLFLRFISVYFCIKNIFYLIIQCTVNSQSYKTLMNLMNNELCKINILHFRIYILYIYVLYLWLHACIVILNVVYVRICMFLNYISKETRVFAYVCAFVPICAYVSASDTCRPRRVVYKSMCLYFCIIKSLFKNISSFYSDIVKSV